MSKIEIETTPEMVKTVYEKLEKNISKFRFTLNRPLTLTEKILAGHLEDEFLDKILDGTKKYVFLIIVCYLQKPSFRTNSSRGICASEAAASTICPYLSNTFPFFPVFFLPLPFCPFSASK